MVRTVRGMSARTQKPSGAGVRRREGGQGAGATFCVRPKKSEAVLASALFPGVVGEHDPSLHPCPRAQAFPRPSCLTCCSSTAAPRCKSSQTRPSPAFVAGRKEKKREEEGCETAAEHSRREKKANAPPSRPSHHAHAPSDPRKWVRVPSTTVLRWRRPQKRPPRKAALSTPCPPRTPTHPLAQRGLGRRGRRLVRLELGLGRRLDLGHALFQGRLLLLVLLRLDPQLVQLWRGGCVGGWW